MKKLAYFTLGVLALLLIAATSIGPNFTSARFYGTSRFRGPVRVETGSGFTECFAEYFHGAGLNIGAGFLYPTDGVTNFVDSVLAGGNNNAWDWNDSGALGGHGGNGSNVVQSAVVGGDVWGVTNLTDAVLAGGNNNQMLNVVEGFVLGGSYNRLINSIEGGILGSSNRISGVNNALAIGFGITNTTPLTIDIGVGNISKSTFSVSGLSVPGDITSGGFLTANSGLAVNANGAEITGGLTVDGVPITGGGGSTSPILVTNSYVGGGTNFSLDATSLANNSIVRITLTKHSGLLFTNASDGKRCDVEIFQDGTGGWNIVTNGPNWRCGDEITGLYVSTNAGTISPLRLAVVGTNAQFRGSLSKYSP